VSVAAPSLTQQSQEALLLAGEWAQTRGATQIEAEHLLLALVDDGHGVAAVVLRACGVDLAKLLQILPPPPQSDTAQPVQKAVPPPSPSFELARKLAADEACTLDHPYVETGHLLLGLLASADATAIGLLEGCGATADQVRAKTLEMLGAPSSPATEHSSITDAELESARRGASSSRFTESAKQVLAAAAEEAQQLGSPTVESTHLLLALTEVKDTIPSAALTYLGVETEGLRSVIADGERQTETKNAETMLGLSGKAAIERAVAEARRLRHYQIAPEHLLLALTTMPDGGVVATLRALGVSVPTARALVLRLTRRAYGSRRLRRFWVAYRVVRVIFSLIALALVLAVTLAVTPAVGFILAELGVAFNPFGVALLVFIVLLVTLRFILAFSAHGGAMAAPIRSNPANPRERGEDADSTADRG
jgi:ATP-dependent Clp protease ATP-binding subunit ClpA